MRATKEFFKAFRLEIEQDVNVQEIKKPEDTTIETLRKQIQELESEKRDLNNKIKELEQCVPVQPKETVQNESEIVGHCLEELIDCADKLGVDYLDKLLTVISAYSFKHGHWYDAQIQKLLARVEVKGKTQLNINEFVANKHVDNEIQNVEPGGIGVNQTSK